MPDQDPADDFALVTFAITMVGAALYIGAAFLYVIL